MCVCVRVCTGLCHTEGCLMVGWLWILSLYGRGFFMTWWCIWTGGVRAMTVQGIGGWSSQAPHYFCILVASVRYCNIIAQLWKNKIQPVFYIHWSGHAVVLFWGFCRSSVSRCAHLHRNECDSEFTTPMFWNQQLSENVQIHECFFLFIYVFGIGLFSL